MDPQQSRPAACISGKVICGKYEVGELIGEGGYGVVFFGRNSAKGNLVAIKAIDLEAIERLPQGEVKLKAKERIKNEDKLLKKCANNPFVVKCLDSYLDEPNRLKIIVMEYCPFGSLSSYLWLRGFIPEEEARIILKQILVGLATLHCNGLWHRDIKPENFLGKTDRFLIADFGEMKELNSEQKKKQTWMKTAGQQKYTMLGTSFFKAPEILLEQPYDHKVDLYSAFVLYYELLTGVPPFYIELTEDKAANNIRLSKEIFSNIGRIYDPQYIKQTVKKIKRETYNLKLSPAAIDFMKNFITLQPQRKGWEFIFKHPYLSDQTHSCICILPLKEPKWQNIANQIQKLVGEEIQQVSTDSMPGPEKAYYENNKNPKVLNQLDRCSYEDYLMMLRRSKFIHFERRRNMLLSDTIKKISQVIPIDKGPFRDLSALLLDYISLSVSALSVHEQEMMKYVKDNEQDEIACQQSTAVVEKKSNFFLQFCQSIKKAKPTQLSRQAVIQKIGAKAEGVLKELSKAERMESIQSLDQDYNYDELLQNWKSILEVQYEEGNEHEFREWSRLSSIRQYALRKTSA